MFNRERAEDIMARNGLEALIAASPANVFYATDVYPYGRSYAILPLDRGVEPALVTPISGSTPVVLMSQSWIRDVRYYGEFYVVTRFAEELLSEAERRLIEAQGSWERSRASDPVDVLVKLLEERGIKRGRIGLDDSNLRRDDPLWDGIGAYLPGLEVVPAAGLFKEIRMVKTAEEIRRLQEAVRITEAAWEEALESVHGGMTEKEFAGTFMSAIASGGGVNQTYLGIYWPPIAFGRCTAFSDIAQPSDYRLRRGDIIRFDGGCAYMGYPCDMGRTAVYGEPEEKLVRFWRAIFEGENRAVSLAEPGARASSIFEATVQEVRKSGIGHYARHHTGHGWGIDGYDPPTIGPKDGTPLEEGMALCFETPYYEVGWGGLIHEDVVIVTEKGPRYLTRFEDELRIVG